MNCFTFNYGGFTQTALAQAEQSYHSDKKRISAKPPLKSFVVDFFLLFVKAENTSNCFHNSSKGSSVCSGKDADDWTLCTVQRKKERGGHNAIARYLNMIDHSVPYKYIYLT